MTLIKSVILKKNVVIKPIWLMRQAGRYLPEFQKIRKKNPNFIKLCLNPKKVREITLQPIKRYDLDAAIIFSDILMVPYGLGQSVEFRKNFGPYLGNFCLSEFKNLPKKNFKNRLNPIYKSIEMVKEDLFSKKDLIGFVGGPWTIILYMLNKISPKKNLKKSLSDKALIIDMIKFINSFIKLHIQEQIKSGANIIQIFDSWAGLVPENNLEDLIYKPNKELVKFTQSLKTPSICFPRNIKNYFEFTKFVKPSAISIDYNVSPEKILKNINIPIQGGMNPSILLTNKRKLEKTVDYYLSVFKNHPYIFNLGHGVLPKTKPNMIEYLIKIVRRFNERSS